MKGSYRWIVLLISKKKKKKKDVVAVFEQPLSSEGLQRLFVFVYYGLKSWVRMIKKSIFWKTYDIDFLLVVAYVEFAE